MAFIFVQFWGPLPTIQEGFMGDTQSGTLPSGEPPNISQSRRPKVSTSNSTSDSESRKASQGTAQPNSAQNTYSQGQSYSTMQQVTPGRPESFDLTSLGGALPDTPYQNLNTPSPRQPPQGQSASQIMYQMQGMPQYAASQAINPQLANASYNMPYPGQYQGMYAQPHIQTVQHLQSGSPSSQFFQGPGYAGQVQQTGSSFYVQPNPYVPQSSIYPGNSPVGQYGMRGGFPGDGAHLQRGSEYPAAGFGSGSQGRSSSIGQPKMSSCLGRYRVADKIV